MTARFLTSRGESSHLPAWETWIQSGGLRKLRSGVDRSFETLPIDPEAYAKRGGKSSRAAASIQVLAAAGSFGNRPGVRRPRCLSPRPATRCRRRSAFDSTDRDSTKRGSAIASRADPADHACGEKLQVEKKRARPLAVPSREAQAAIKLRLHLVWPCRGPVPRTASWIGLSCWGCNSVLATRSSLCRLRSTQVGIMRHSDPTRL